jgi:hypothetical protein
MGEGSRSTTLEIADFGAQLKRNDTEATMKLRWLVIGIAGLGITGMIAADQALARTRHKVPPACADRPTSFSWQGFFFNGRPQPNGCAPAVIEHGEYVGQDPDVNIRTQLRRDPTTGYTYFGK